MILSVLPHVNWDKMLSATIETLYMTLVASVSVLDLSYF